MRRILMTMAMVVAALVAAVGFTATPASAAVDRPFSMAYGASTTSGTVHFTDGRSASVGGAVHAVTTPKYVCASGANGNLSDYGCGPITYPGGPNVAYNIGLRIDVRGGVHHVVIDFMEIANTGDHLIVASTYCDRTSCSKLF